MNDNNKATDQVEILAPEISLTIAGREITMHEPTFLESMHLEPAIAPLLDEVQRRTEDGEDVVTALMGLVSEYQDVLLDMICLCAGVDRKWLDSLNDENGYTLMLTFWRVNRHFFARRLRLRRALAASSAAGPGARSSQH